MVRIPTTRAEFERMDLFTQSDVKKRLLQDIFNTVCSSLSIQVLAQFRPVLHEDDLEELLLSRERYSRANIIMNLLMKIQCSLRRNPTWWEVLEKVLINQGLGELYRILNPWLEGGAAGGEDDGRGSGGGDDGRGGGQGGGTGGETRGGTGGKGPADCGGPGPPFSLGSLPASQAPYPWATPVAQTSRIHLMLAPLFEEGNDTLWRDLADLLDLSVGDQLQVIKKAKTGDTSRLLMDQIIQRHGDAATVGYVVQALLELGEEGQGVVRRMEEERLIPPVERAGSEADGEAMGVPDYNVEREGGASARSSQPPIPIFPRGNVTASVKPKADSTNLSHDRPGKHRPLEKRLFGEQNDANEKLKPRQSVSSSETATQSELDGEASLSSDSIVDNARQSNVSSIPAKEEKILNCPPVSGELASITGKETSSRRSFSVETDTPQHPHQSVRGMEKSCDEKTPTPSVQQDTPQWLQSSQQEIVNQVRAASQDAVPMAQQSCLTSPAELHRQTSIINVNIKCADKVIFGQETKIMQKSTPTDGEPEDDLQVPVTADSVISAGNMESPSSVYPSPPARERYEGDNHEQNLDSYHPHPTDLSAHETYRKEVLHGSDDEQYLPVCCEGPVEGEQDFDIRQNHTNEEDRFDSLTYDRTLTPRSPCTGPDTLRRLTHSAESLPGSMPVVLPRGETEAHTDRPEPRRNSTGPGCEDPPAAASRGETEVNINRPASTRPPQHHDTLSQQHATPSAPAPQPQNAGAVAILSSFASSVKDGVFTVFGSVKDAYLCLE